MIIRNIRIPKMGCILEDIKDCFGNPIIVDHDSINKKYYFIYKVNTLYITCIIKNNLLISIIVKENNKILYKKHLL